MPACAMQAAEREWRGETDKPLKMVAGPFVLVATAALYRPSAFLIAIVPFRS